MTQDAATHALGPWAERVVDSTPETRAELTRNVASAIAVAVAEAVKERERELGRDRGPGCISGCSWGLDDKFHHHPYCETFGGEKPLVMGGRTWIDEGRHNMDVLRAVAEARREERTKALERINAFKAINKRWSTALAEVARARDSLLLELEGWKQKNQKDNEYLLARASQNEQAMLMQQRLRFDAEQRVGELEAECVRLTKDLYSYAGALGYPIPGDHDGRHSNGTTPVCGFCSHKNAALARPCINCGYEPKIVRPVSAPEGTQ